MIDVIEGDVTKLEVDAIVNAANQTLLGGGGVDGAIHSAAGPGLLAECKKLNGCPTGEARITKGYRLPAKYVIHTVGPIWRDGKRNEYELLANCYRNSLQLAIENSVESIAFPAISTGIYHFPINRACDIALKETRHFQATHGPSPLKLIVFACFNQNTYDCYHNAIARKPDPQHDAP